jgi:hypothetical protein
LRNYSVHGGLGARASTGGAHSITTLGTAWMRAREHCIGCEMVEADCFWLVRCHAGVFYAWWSACLHSDMWGFMSRDQYSDSRDCMRIELYVWSWWCTWHYGEFYSEIRRGLCLIVEWFALFCLRKRFWMNDCIFREVIGVFIQKTP